MKKAIIPLDNDFKDTEKGTASTHMEDMQTLSFCLRDSRLCACPFGPRVTGRLQSLIRLQSSSLRTPESVTPSVTGEPYFLQTALFEQQRDDCNTMTQKRQVNRL